MREETTALNLSTERLITMGLAAGSCRQISYQGKQSDIVSGKTVRYRIREIRVITKLPNSEQSYKGKVKTHKYINKQNRKTVKTVMTLTWYRHF